MGRADSLDLLPGTLELLILRTLLGGREHGYGIAQRLRVPSEVRLVLVFALSIALSGCSSSNPSEPSGPGGTAGNVTTVIVAGTPPAIATSSQFTAIAVGSDGSSQTVTSQATWRSSNTSVASVNSSGMVTALIAGSVEISATYANTKGALTFTVTPAATFAVKGTIRDAVSGGPVTSAAVTVKDASGETKSTVTDSAGQYSIAGVAGPVEVTARALNYVTTTRSVTVLADMTIDFTLPRAAPCPLIGFDDLRVHGAAFTTYTACGFTITPTTANWTVSTSYGHPAPFVQFMSASGATTIGELLVTAAGGKFTFQSVDVYSSTTPIPYVITGIANSATVLNIQNTQGNTFGNFATVVNPQPATQVDALLIRLSNPAAACCSNPMGLDNIKVAF